MPRHRSSSLAALCLGSLLVLGAAGPGFAQALTALTGQSDLQRRVGGAVSATCAGLAARGTDPTGSSAEEDLFGRCRELVQTGNEIVGSGPTAASLGLDDAEANDALLRVAHEELSAAGAQAIGLAHLNIATLEKRLYALREGATGIQLAGLHLPVHSFAPGSTPLSLNYGALVPMSANGDLGSERFGIFVNGLGSFGDFGGNSEEAGFDFRTYGVTGGLDYRFTESVVAGLAFGWETTDHDFDQSAGDLDKEAYTASLYGTWNQGPWFVDAIVSYSYLDFTGLRRRIQYADVNRTARGDTRGDEWAAEIGFGARWQSGAWTFGPHARLTAIDIEIEGFTERGALGLNLDYRDQDIRSLRSVLGGEVSYAISTPFGILLPYLRAEWEHEFEDDARDITASYAADPAGNRFAIRTKGPDRDSINLGGGVTMTFPGGVSAFLDVDGILALRDVNQVRVILGGRVAF